MENENLRIVRMEAQAVKRLKAAAIEPDPDSGTVVVSGSNASGKSSLLDSIFYALAGGRNIPDEPVQEGSDTAHVELELGDGDTEYIVRRHWDRDRKSTGKNGKLEIKLADGSEPEEPPQQILDSMLSDITFDPSEFLRMTPSEQRDALIEAVDLPVDLDELKEAREEHYQERRDVKRDLSKAEGKLDELQEPSEDLPEEPVDINELTDKRDDLKTKIQELESIHGGINQHSSRLRESLDSAENVLDGYDLEDTKSGLSTLVDPVKADVADTVERIEEGVEELTDEIQSAQETNQALRDAQDYRETVEKRDELQEQVDELNEEIELIDETKEDVLEEVDLPNPDLGFGEDGLTYEGLPFEQAEMSAQIRTAVAIAMSSDPDIRIVRLKEGSFLDEDSLELLDGLAREYNFQAWVEYVDQGGDMGIYIEEGSVQEVNDGHKESSE